MYTLEEMLWKKRRQAEKPEEMLVRHSKKRYKVVGPNGNFIFLPTAGYIINSSLFAAGSYGYYWSSSLNTSSPSCAYSVVFISSSMGRRDYDYRYRGRSVRSVCP